MAKEDNSLLMKGAQGMGKMVKSIFGGTRASSKVAKSLGTAARKGGGGHKTIAKAVKSLAKNPIKANLVGKNGKLNLGPGKKRFAKSVKKATGIGAGSRKASGGGGRSH